MMRPQVGHLGASDDSGGVTPGPGHLLTGHLVCRRIEAEQSVPRAAVAGAAPEPLT